MAQPTNKKPSPAKPPAAKPAQAKPTTVEDLDDEDLDGDTDDGDDGASASNGSNGKGASWKETMKLPPAKRVAVRIGNLVDRTQHQLDAMKNWKGEEQEAVRAIVVQAQDALKAAAERLAQIPDDWRPTRAAGGGGGSKAEIEPGTVVRLTEKRAPEYADVIPEEHQRGIKVKEVRGNKVVCILADGMVAMIPRGHVTVDDAAAA